MRVQRGLPRRVARSFPPARAPVSDGGSISRGITWYRRARDLHVGAGSRFPCAGDQGRQVMSRRGGGKRVRLMRNADSRRKEQVQPHFLHGLRTVGADHVAWCACMASERERIALGRGWKGTSSPSLLRPGSRFSHPAPTRAYPFSPRRRDRGFLGRENGLESEGLPRQTSGRLGGCTSMHKHACLIHVCA